MEDGENGEEEKWKESWRMRENCGEKENRNVKKKKKVKDGRQ